MSSTQQVHITRYKSGQSFGTNDLLTVEEPLEIGIRYGLSLMHKSLSVNMRTPGHDEELGLGFLFSEGIISHQEQVIGTVQEAPDCLTFLLHEDVVFDPTDFERHVYAASGCGICGKSSLAAIRQPVAVSDQNAALWNIEATLLTKFPEILSESQTDFETTGGLHAAALLTPDGRLAVVREDIGRHNAVDKLIGYALTHNLLPLSSYVLLLSGRAGFELIQKAAFAGITFVAAVGAPSSLAVALAQDQHMTLVGFLRNERFNVYSGNERILYP